jgi:hypothetical protein
VTAEQFVAQELISQNNKIRKTGTIKSLIQFMGEKQSLGSTAIKLDLKYRNEFLHSHLKAIHFIWRNIYFNHSKLSQVKFKTE